MSNFGSQTDAAVTESSDASTRVSSAFRSKRRRAAAAVVVGSVLVALPLIGATSTGDAPDAKPVASETSISHPDPGPIGVIKPAAPMTTAPKRTAPKPTAKAKAPSSALRASRSESRTALAEPSKSKPSSKSKTSGSPKSIAQAQLAERGWSGQFSCLNSLWEKESGWDPGAYNSASGATGIPQALPGSKMASAGSDWRTNPATQIKWGLGYIAETYGTPCAAWSQSQSNNWY